MKKTLLFLGIVLFWLVNLNADNRPNFVFIFADDLGWGDLGCYGHPQLKTPNLDKMASEGLLLTNFYVANPVCSPSRTAVMTGQYPVRHRIHRHFTSNHDRNASLNMPDFLDPKVTLVTRLMKENGYKTGHFGKWHLGGTPDAPPPSAYGIDYSFTSNSRGSTLNVPRNQSTEKMVDAAISFIEQNKDENFFLNIWTLVPHATLDPTDEQMEPYKSLGARGPAKARGFSTPRQIYYGAVTDMDLHMGV